MLTIKSDDIRGRLKTYERIVKGENLSKPGVPESFRVLIKELQGLGLDVEIKYSDGTFGELVVPNDDESKGFKRPSLRPDSGIDDLGFGDETENRTSNLLFDDDSDELDGLHITDEIIDEDVLSDDDDMIPTEEDLFDDTDSDLGEDE